MDRPRNPRSTRSAKATRERRGASGTRSPADPREAREPGGDAPPCPDIRAYVALAELGERYWRLAPWEVFGEEPVAVLLPGEAEPSFAVFMGEAGESYGIAVLRGLAGLRWLEEADEADDDHEESVDQVAVSMERAPDLWPHDRAWRKDAGLGTRRGARLASTLVKRPGRVPRGPDGDELAFLARTAAAVVVALESGTLVPVGRRGDTFRTVHVGDAGAAPTVATRTWHAPEPPEIAPVLPPKGLAGRRAGPATWVVGIRDLPTMVDHDDRVMRGLLVADPESGILVGNAIVPGADPADAAREFWGVLERLPASVPLPSRVGFTSRSCLAAVGPGLRAHRITAVRVRRSELLDDAFAGLIEMLCTGG